MAHTEITLKDLKKENITKLLLSLQVNVTGLLIRYVSV